MESPSSSRKNNGTVLHLILKYRLLLDSESKWGVQLIKDTMTWIWSQQNSENENQSHDGMKLLEHDAWECFDMQHSHEAMTYQDEVVDEHEPAKKITLHNSELKNSKLENFENQNVEPRTVCLYKNQHNFPKTYQSS